MFIRCETNNKWDRFYIPNIETMKDLKEYADKDMPIECYKLTFNHFGDIYFKEENQLVHLYLNNFLYYKQIEISMMSESEWELLYKNNCKNCTHNSSYHCRFEFTLEDNCKSFKKQITFKDLFNKFRRK